MSASGYKRTLSPYLENVRFTPESGHWPSPRQHELDQPIVVGGLHEIATDVAVLCGFHRPVSDYRYRDAYISYRRRASQFRQYQALRKLLLRIIALLSCFFG